nr:UBN2 domain-containing protein [Tanacetum cinerariifolium]GEV47337.1 UBN2 domain-containing protein [Tanacetum cinerariifolium]
MKRQEKDFYGKITPLFETMMVQPQEDMGEDIPTNSHYTPTVNQPSTSSPSQKKQKSKKSKKKIIQVPQLSDSTNNVADEHVTTTSSDPLLSGKDRLKLTELVEFYTKLQSRVLALETTKANQALEIRSLKRRVKKLEKKASKKTHKLKRLYKIGSSTRMESSEDTGLGDQEDATKQGRMVDDLDADEGVTLEVSTADPFPTAGEVVTTAGVEDNTQAIMDADYELAARLQEEKRGELTIEEKSREDLEVLWSILKERFKKTKPVDDMDNLLFQTLMSKTIFGSINKGGRLVKAMYLNEVFGYIPPMKTKLLIKKLKIQKVNIKFRGGLLGLKNFMMILVLLLLRLILLIRLQSRRLVMAEISFIDFLDHVSADPSKVSSMLELPVLNNGKELRGFLGLIGYYSKVTTIEESKDLTSLSLEELIGNLIVHEMIVKKDSKIIKAKGGRKSIALKAKKESSDEECLTFESKDEEYAMVVRDFKKFFKRSEVLGVKDDEKVKDKKCLVAQASNEVCCGLEWWRVMGRVGSGESDGKIKKRVYRGLAGKMNSVQCL